MSMIQPGTCRHCGCTEDDACRLETGDPCWWTDREQVVCSSPSCILAEQARLARARAESKYKDWGYGAICEDLRKRDRKSRRKGRAA